MLFSHALYKQTYCNSKHGIAQNALGQHTQIVETFGDWMELKNMQIN